MKFTAFLKSLGFKSTSPYAWEKDGINVSKNSNRGGGYVVSISKGSTNKKFIVSSLSDIDNSNMDELIVYIYDIIYMAEQGIV